MNIQIEGAILPVNVKPVINVSNERLTFDTQKPEGLLQILSCLLQTLVTLLPTSSAALVQHWQLQKSLDGGGLEATFQICHTGYKKEATRHPQFKGSK